MSAMEVTSESLDGIDDDPLFADDGTVPPGSYRGVEEAAEQTSLDNQAGTLVERDQGG